VSVSYGEYIYYGENDAVKNASKGEVHYENKLSFDQEF
jgi:hypothetical protein